MPRSHTLRIPTRDPGIVQDHIRAHRPACGLASAPEKIQQKAGNTPPIRQNVIVACAGQPKNRAFYTEKCEVPGAAPTAPGMTPPTTKEKDVRIYG